MQKTIFTIGFYVICLSVFTFCYATPTDDIVVSNALENLNEMDKAVTKQENKVQDAWDRVNAIAEKWENTTDENRRKNMPGFLLEMLGSGFWKVTFGADSDLQSEMDVKCYRLFRPKFSKVKTSFFAQIPQVSNTLTQSEGVCDYILV